MTTFVLISGTLYRAPEQKIARSGKSYIVATIKARDGDGFQFWRLTAFAETVQTELRRLSDGDAIAVQGPLQASVYTPEGKEPRINLSLVADGVLPLRQPPRERKPKPDKPATPRVMGGARSPSR